MKRTTERRLLKLGICYMCGKEFMKKLMGAHIYCGSKSNKTSCSYKHYLDLLAKWRKRNPHYSLKWQRANRDKVAVHNQTARDKMKSR